MSFASLAHVDFTHVDCLLMSLF